MATAAHERLSAMDRSFLVFEDAGEHMHLAGVAILDGRPLIRPEGGVAIERIRRHFGSRLHWLPRLRQRLAWVPIYNSPVWVDDADFDVSYHVRQAALPYPGDDAMLKGLTARLASEPLDRNKPLWEFWIIEGLQEERVALFGKMHHAVADGILAFYFFASLVSMTPDTAVEEAPPWTPQPVPTRSSLLRDEFVFQTTRPIAIVRDAVEVLRTPDRLLSRASEGLRALRHVFGAGSSPAPATPLNQRIGRNRRCDWLTLDLDDVKAIKKRLGGTVNDVVLAIVGGAVRRFLVDRGVDIRGLQYRVTVPVNVRGQDEQGLMNNRVSGWLLTLPVDEPDAQRRYDLVSQRTAELKSVHQELGPSLLQRALEYAPAALTLTIRLLIRLNSYNLVVSNLPGPPLPLYFLGAQLVGGYPLVPLFENQGLSVGITSYCGTLYWGFNADRDLVPDLDRFVGAVRAEVDELRDVAALEPGAETRPGPARALRHSAGRRRRRSARAAVRHSE